MQHLQKFWAFLRSHYKAIGFTILGFTIGLVLFLPLERIQLTLFKTIEKQTGMRISANSLKISTGFLDGWTYGGLLALQMDTATLQVQSFEWKCETLRVSPHLWKLLLLKIDLGVSCQMTGDSKLQALVKDIPLSAPSTLNLKVQVTNWNLETLAVSFPSLELEGILDGEMEVFGMKLNGFRELPQTTWNLEAKSFTAPPVNHPFVKIPSIAFGALKTRGNMKGRKIEVANLTAGNAQSPMELITSMYFELDQGWVPTKGDINGTMRTDKDFEEQIKNALDLDSIFGKVKASGKREFKKSFDGSPIMLLQPPTS